MLEMFRHTPIWVFFLFFALLAFGLIQTRPQVFRAARVLALPLALSIMTAASAQITFRPAGYVGIAWALGFAAGLGVAWLAPMADPAWRDAQSGKVMLAGSVVPLILMMTMFALRYAVAAASARNAGLRASVEVAVSVCLAYGLLGGMFLGRALRVTRFARHAQMGGRAAAR